jgi:MATE family multidrug resistance protein
MMGTMVLTSNAYGEEDYKKCGRVWRRSMPYAVALGLLGTILCFFAEPLFLSLGQDSAISKGAAEVCLIIALGIPMTMMMISSTFFLEAIHKPVPGMIMMLIANILNIGLNYVLVYGHYGFEAMGATGTAWATTAVRTFLAVALFIYIWNMKDHKKFGIRKKVSLKLKDWKMQRKIGYGTGLTNGIEHAGFAALYIFGGWIGGIALSSMSITFNIFGVAFMIALGISGATSVRVGVAYGRNDPLDMKIAGFAGLSLTTAVMIPLTAAMVFMPEFFIQFFTTDSPLIAYTIPLVVICGLMTIFDCGQTVIGGALRGRRDVWVPTILYIISYLMIMVPLCYYLTFTMNHGASGLMEGVVIASIFSLFLLTGRFMLLCKQDEKGNAKS